MTFAMYALEHPELVEDDDIPMIQESVKGLRAMWTPVGRGLTRTQVDALYNLFERLPDEALPGVLKMIPPSILSLNIICNSSPRADQLARRYNEIVRQRGVNPRLNRVVAAVTSSATA